jgi:excisionase family DNA binding protein
VIVSEETARMGGAVSSLDAREDPSVTDRPEIPSTKRYLTVKETAFLLGVSIKTVYRAIATGELPARRIRRSVRVPRYAVVTDGQRDHVARCAGAAGRGTVLDARRVASLEE